jgi:hypothetical protein
MTDETCPTCNGALIEIDHYGERFVGCIKCNKWRPANSPPGRLSLQLPDEDLEALSDKRRKAEDESR